MQVKVYYQWFDAKGHPISRKRLCRSFVKQFLQLLESMTAHAYGSSSDLVSITDTSNAAKSIIVTGGAALATAYAYNRFASEASSGITTYGLLVGTGNTAPTVSNYAMETLIANGTGAGQLSYGATAVGAATPSGSNVILAIARSFTNGTANPITVLEIGWAVSNIDTAAAQCYFLVLRDLSTQTINAGVTSTLTLTVVTTV